MRETLDALSLTSVLVLTLAVVLAAIELGYRTGHWRQQHLGGRNESEAQLSAMTGAHLALLAFIMAFSFSMAAGHYQERRALILEDANAIGTAYLRAELIETPQSVSIRQLLIEYAGIRADFKNLEQAQHLLVEAEKIQEQIWLEVQQLTRQQAPNVLHSLLIQSLNEVFDIHEERIAAGIKNRVPKSLWVVLAALLILAMLGIGYFSGYRGVRNPIASTALALSFSLVLFLIADLDRPTSGMVKADQTAMNDLLEELEKRHTRGR